MTDLSNFYTLHNFIDTFALGHYARTLEAYDIRGDQQTAFKVLRLEHLTDNGEIKWEYRAFGNEVELLAKLASSPQVIDLLDCGYISSQSETPDDGEIVSMQRDVIRFIQSMTDFANKNWRPYITMPNLPRTNSLFYLMKPSQQSSRWRLPTEEGLALAWQFGQFLQSAHQQGIVYLDHKLEHVYWDGNRLEVIDLNSSRQLDRMDSNYYRMDIHNLCVGILYPIFTGLSPLKTTLRPQPSSQSEVEGRYKDVTTLDFGVEPTLSPALCELLQRGAAMQIESIDEYIDGLQEVASLHGWDFPNHYTSPASRSARDHMREGLRKLREGQENLREARDLFREAAILDDITSDLEEELRRLVKTANDMLNNRVIP